MFHDLLSFLQCPTCGFRPLVLVAGVEADDEVIEGGVACERCGHVTPIEEGILDALGEAPVPWTPAQLTNYAPLAAWGYERLWRPHALRLLSGERFTLEKELRLVRSLIGAGRDGLFVDVACSTGLYARAFAVDAPGVSIAAVDHSRAMLREARRYARREGRRISFVRASAQALPFASGTVAGYGMGGSLNEIGDIGRALDEARRVIAADGRFVSMNLIAAATRPGRALQRLLSTGGIQFPPVVDLNRRVEDAGLRVVGQWCWRVVMISMLCLVPDA
ncbi:MAG TPA: methyltransferase domain-containing protein [Herpetosiphonaceae bacterium]|nr:methyltransferase domain-containing protein [Herpetosiphonaceae bacterium]